MFVRPYLGKKYTEKDIKASNSRLYWRLILEHIYTQKSFSSKHESMLKNNSSIGAMFLLF